MSIKTIYILSPAIGAAGGADKATCLLAEEYAKLGCKAEVFATSVEVKPQNDQIRVHPPPLNKGHRWKMPHTSLVWKLFLRCLARPPLFIHCVGLTYEVRLALKYMSRYRIVVWETTEVKPGNKFVDQKIIPYLNKAVLLLAPCETIRRNFEPIYHYKGKSAVLPFWVEWLPDRGIPYHSRKGNLLYLGRLDQDKGFDVLFDALRLCKTIISVDICGKGNAEVIAGLCRDLPGVRIYGFVSGEKLEQFFEMADFLILPSKYEGYPLTLIEACGRYKPVIASDVGSIPEVFSNSKAAFIFESENTKKMASLLDQAYSESDHDYNTRMTEARMMYDKINHPDKIRSNLKRILEICQV